MLSFKYHNVYKSDYILISLRLNHIRMNRTKILINLIIVVFPASLKQNIRKQGRLLLPCNCLFIYVFYL